MKILVIGASKDTEKILNALTHYKNKFPLIDFYDLAIFSEKWQNEFELMLSEADAVLCFCSQNSKESPNVNWEREKVLNANKKLLEEELTDEPNVSGKFEQRERVFFKIERLLKEEQLLIYYQNTGTEENRNYLMEQYKLMLQTSETLLQRRQQVSNLYVSISSIIIPIIGILLVNENHYLNLVAAILSFVMTAVNFSWIKIIQLYGDLNYAKFQVLQEIEFKFPIKLFACEWQTRMSAAKPKQKNCFSFTLLEKRLPKFFIVVYLTLCAISLVLFTLKVLQA